MSVLVKKQIMQRLENLPGRKLSEVLLFVEFLYTRESPEFIAYVTERTENALNAKNKGEKFYSLKELQEQSRFLRRTK